MADTVCPRCRTTKFQNPSLKMMVNVCGHALCESCVDLLFLKGAAACPECHTQLRRNNFRVQLFEDPLIEKDVDIRKRVLKDYNKKEEDFATLRDYNDYLEEIETIVFNLTNNIDIVNTNKRIEEYKRSNKEQIQKSRNKISKEDYQLEELIEFEKQQDILRRTNIQQEEKELKTKKLRQKEALIDELMFSNANATNIVNSFEQIKETEMKPTLTKVTQFSTGVRFGSQSLNSMPVIVEGPLYVYKPQPQVVQGPNPPSDNDYNQHGYYKHIRQETSQERAGGFTSNISCLRAVQDALAGLYHVKTP